MLESRLRVDLITPCLGIGGADALIMGLVRYCYNIDFVGCAVEQRVTTQQRGWLQRAMPYVPIHESITTTEVQEDDEIYDNHVEAIEKACENADLILSWGTPHLNRLIDMDKPVIDYAQNTSKHYKVICDSNKRFAYYKAACSKSVAKACYPTKDDVAVIYNGIDPGRVSPRLNREIQRKVWGIGEEDKVLLFMGRFVEEKRPGSVIQVLSKLENWKGIFCGAGPQEDQLYNEAQRYAPGRVYFIKPQYHVGDILSSSDVFILPSDYEGHSLALCEAWLAGVSTVYSDMPVCKELEDEFGMMGTMIKRKATTEEMVEAVIRADGLDTSRVAAANARTVTWHNFTLPAIAWQWEEYFEYCVTDWRKRKSCVVIDPVKVL